MKTADNPIYYINQNAINDSVDVSVIIPTYNRGHILKKVVESWKEVHRNTRCSYEIIFSDDGSTDNSLDILSAEKELPIIVLKNLHGGASMTRNAAIRIAKGERILIIGDDIFPNINLIDQHYQLGNELEKKYSKVTILGRVDWHPALKVNHLMRHITEIGNEQFSFNRLKSGDFTDFRYFYTCNISVDRYWFDNEGILFDERFFDCGFEDMELGYRLAQKGMLIYYDENLSAYHYHPYELEKFCKRVINVGKLALIFAEIHPELDYLSKAGSILEKYKKISTVKNWTKLKIENKPFGPIKRYCEKKEKIIEHQPSAFKKRIFERQLSFIFRILFEAHYEVGILTKIFSFEESEKLVYLYHFKNFKTSKNKVISFYSFTIFFFEKVLYLVWYKLRHNTLKHYSVNRAISNKIRNFLRKLLT